MRKILVSVFVLVALLFLCGCKGSGGGGGSLRAKTWREDGVVVKAWIDRRGQPPGMASIFTDWPMEPVFYRINLEDQEGSWRLMPDVPRYDNNNKKNAARFGVVDEVPTEGKVVIEFKVRNMGTDKILTGWQVR